MANQTIKSKFVSRIFGLGLTVGWVLLIGACGAAPAQETGVRTPTVSAVVSATATGITPPEGLAMPQYLRVSNQSDLLLKNLVVVFPNERIAFGDVPAGETTGYQAAPSGVYRYAAYSVEVDGRQYDQPVLDWVGETPVTGAAFTYTLEADPSRWESEGQVIRLVGVQADQTTENLTALPEEGQAALPTVRETPLALPPGLTVEEYALAAMPEIDPLTFIPLQGSQAEVLSVHEQAREKTFPPGTFLPDAQLSMQAQTGADLWVATMHVDTSDPENWVGLNQNGQEIYRIDTGATSPINSLQSLWAYDGHWALETVYVTSHQEGNNVSFATVGQISRDGELLNELYGYDEAFSFQLIAGRPFYFFEQAGKIDFSYDGQVVETGYDQIPHYRCCSGAETNPRHAIDMIAFFAQRNSVWYYVEIGVYP